jgi:hypothetical protein
MNDELIKALGSLQTEQLESLLKIKTDEFKGLKENFFTMIFQIVQTESLVNLLQKEIILRNEEDEEINVFIDQDEDEQPREAFNPFKDDEKSNEGITDEKMELLLKINKLQSEVESFLRKGVR